MEGCRLAWVHGHVPRLAAYSATFMGQDTFLTKIYTLIIHGVT